MIGTILKIWDKSIIHVDYFENKTRWRPKLNVKCLVDKHIYFPFTCTCISNESNAGLRCLFKKHISRAGFSIMGNMEIETKSKIETFILVYDLKK